jgi:Ricin-type beta-trefoil lectin domain
VSDRCFFIQTNLIISLILIMNSIKLRNQFLNRYYLIFLIIFTFLFSSLFAINANAVVDGVTIQQVQNSGTLSSGGIFTPEVRAFLDAIAKYESETNYLSAESYNSGNYVPNDFDAQSSTNTRPKLKSGGVAPQSAINKGYGRGAWNIGRYQYFSGEYTMGDIDAANSGLKIAGIDFKIIDFKPSSQDYYPIGKYALRASVQKRSNKNLSLLLAEGDSGLNEAIGVSSGEWASMPVVTGYKHAATNQAKWSLSGFKSFYNSRKKVYQGNQVAVPESKAENKSLVTLLAPNTFIFKAKSNTKKCLDLSSSKIEQNNKIQIWTCNSTNAQKWELNRDLNAEDGQIKSVVNRDWCIDFNPDPTKTLTYLTVCETEDVHATQWMYTEEGQLKPLNYPELCMTLSDSKIKNGQPIILKTCDNSILQTWVI